MEDIVDRLSKFPIAEWNDARTEILRLRDLLSEGLPDGGLKYIPNDNDLSSEDARTKIAELESLVASLNTTLEDKESTITVLKQQANTTPTALITARAEIEALEKKLSMVLELSNSAVEKRSFLESELVKVNTLLTTTNSELLSARNLNTGLTMQISNLEGELLKKGEALNAALANIEDLKGGVKKLEPKNVEPKNKVFEFFANRVR